MSRRDTVIIAVLVNAGLMALLFMLAINTGEETVSDKIEIAQTLTEVPRPIVPESIATNPILLSDLNGSDEVDAFLKDLVITEYAPGMAYEENILEVEKKDLVVVSKPQTPPPSPVPQLEEKFVEITVKRGDALEKIARHNGTTVEAIKKANNLTSVKLSIGQVLRVPVSQKGNSEKSTSVAIAEAPKPAPAKTVEQKATPVAEPQYYTIKSGDNPWKIAKQFQVRFDDLLKLNDLDEEKARNLKIGDKIRVR